MHTHPPTRRTLLSAAVWLVLGSGARADAAISRALRLACNPDVTSRISGLILQELYGHVGVAPSILEMPPARASAEATSGRVDGEVNRIRSYGEGTPTLVRVEPAIHLLGIGALFRKGSAVRIQSMADLGRYTVGYVRGIKFAEDMAKDAARTVVLDDSVQLMRMLIESRVDVIATADTVTRLQMRALGVSDKLEFAPLGKIPLFHYLHEKNRDLVPVISGLLRKATDSGELDRLRAQHEKQVFDAVVPGKP